mgnify:CR=1 FL=1|tara:strand:- start:94 stop:303 length:210 start_codon:yes stop_codon:yes gene_type:complete
MKVELTNKDLIAMVNGVSPDYHLFENKLVKPYGRFNASYGTWSWNSQELKYLSDEKLYKIYVLCRDSFK